MADQIDTYAIEFNKSVLKGLKLSIADIYKQLVKHGRGGTNAGQILKHRIDRVAMTELCPQVFKAITEQYEMMKRPDASMMKNGVRYDQFNWDIKDTETLDILRKNNVFLTSKYYNRLEAGKVRERIEKAFTEGKSPASIANALRFEFGDLNKGLRAYNEMFVDTISHTARNFANINTYQQIGVEYSKIVGFKDELTCPQCSRLIGRIVSVETQAKAVNDYLSVDFEKLGYDKALEQIKTVNPWWTEKGLIGAGFEKPNYKSDAENIRETAKLIQPGLELPIFHGRCRCSTAAYFGNKGSLPLVSGGGGGILPVKPVVAKPVKPVTKPAVPTKIKPLIKPAPDDSIIDITGSKPFDLKIQALSNKLKAAKTAKDVEDLYKQQLGLINCNLSGIDLNLAKLNLLKLDELVKSYKCDLANIESIINDSVFGHYDPRTETIGLNANSFSDLRVYRKSRIREAGSGNKVKVDDKNRILSTTVHELAHSIVLENKASLNYANEVWNPVREIRQAYIDEVDKHLKAFWKSKGYTEKGVRYSGKKARIEPGAYDYVRQQMGNNFISKYGEDGAGKNMWSEFVAESFTKAKLGTPGKYDGQVLTIIDKYFKK